MDRPGEDKNVPRVGVDGCAVEDVAGGAFENAADCVVELGGASCVRELDVASCAVELDAAEEDVGDVAKDAPACAKDGRD